MPRNRLFRQVRARKNAAFWALNFEKNRGAEDGKPHPDGVSICWPANIGRGAGDGSQPWVLEGASSNGLIESGFGTWLDEERNLRDRFSDYLELAPPR